MLNRRTFLRMASALGLGSLWSTVPALAAPTVGPLALYSSIPDQPIPIGFRLDYGASAIPQIERFENLLDDLDCVEIATKLTGNWLQAVSGREGCHLKFAVYCPVCTHSWAEPTMTVTSSHYWCEGCQIGGTAIDLYQRMTGLSYGAAMSRLEGLLESRDIQGHREEYQYQWRLWEETIRFHQEALLHSSEAGEARAWLRQQGIDRETWQNFEIGYALRSRTSMLRASLLERGLLAHNSKESWDALEGCAQDALVLPITDWRGHYWGCLRQPLQDFPGGRGSGMEVIREISPRRLRRLVFEPPGRSDVCPRSSILLTQDAWDVVALYNAGIRDIGYWLPNPSPVDMAYALRTTLAMASTIILPWYADTASLDTLLALVGPAVSRVHLLVLRRHDGLVRLLQEEGAEGVRHAMATAIPLTEWMR